MTITQGGPNQAINITEAPAQGKAPYSYYFGLSGAYLGNLMPPNTAGVNPNPGNESTWPEVMPGNAKVSSGITKYSFFVIDAGGCKSAVSNNYWSKIPYSAAYMYMDITIQ